jgi:hypothetical protein
VLDRNKQIDISVTRNFDLTIDVVTCDNILVHVTSNNRRVSLVDLFPPHIALLSGRTTGLKGNVDSNMQSEQARIASFKKAKKYSRRSSIQGSREWPHPTNGEFAAISETLAEAGFYHDPYALYPVSIVH